MSGPKFDETADILSVRDNAQPWLVISSAAGVRSIPLPRQPRVVVGRMPIDDRASVYARIGDVFAIGCLGATVVFILVSGWRRIREVELRSS